MKDFLGQDVGVGDHIVYATSRSSNVEMHHGKLLEIRKRGGDGYYADNIIAKVRVIRKEVWKWNEVRMEHDILKNQPLTVTLSCLDRIVKVEVPLAI